MEVVRDRALATLGFVGRAKRTTDMETEQQGEDVAIGAYKLINIDVDPEFGADCKAWATSAITSYHKGEKNHFQDVAQAIKQGEYGATHAPRNNVYARIECRCMGFSLLMSICVLFFASLAPVVGMIDAETKYGKAFHVIVGKSFGSFVSHEASKYVACTQAPRLQSPTLTHCPAPHLIPICLQNGIFLFRFNQRPCIQAWLALRYRCILRNRAMNNE